MQQESLRPGLMISLWRFLDANKKNKSNVTYDPESGEDEQNCSFRRFVRVTCRFVDLRCVGGSDRRTTDDPRNRCHWSQGKHNKWSQRRNFLRILGTALNCPLDQSLISMSLSRVISKLLLRWLEYRNFLLKTKILDHRQGRHSRHYFVSGSFCRIFFFFWHSWSDFPILFSDFLFYSSFWECGLLLSFGRRKLELFTLAMLLRHNCFCSLRVLYLRLFRRNTLYERWREKRWKRERKERERTSGVSGK